MGNSFCNTSTVIRLAFAAAGTNDTNPNIKYILNHCEIISK